MARCAAGVIVIAIIGCKPARGRAVPKRCGCAQTERPPRGRPSGLYVADDQAAIEAGLRVRR
jgi:hypothetical protein